MGFPRPSTSKNNEMEANNMKRQIVQRLVERCKNEGKRAKDIALELKRAGFKVFVASFCVCEEVVFFDTLDGLQVRLLA